MADKFKRFNEYNFDLEKKENEYKLFDEYENEFKEDEFVSEVEGSDINGFIDGSKGVVAGGIQGLGGFAEFVNWSVANPIVGTTNTILQFVAGNGWRPELLEKEYFAESGIGDAMTPEFLLPETMGGNINKNVVAFFGNYLLGKQGIKEIAMKIVNPKNSYVLAKENAKKLAEGYKGLRMEVAAGAFADVTAFSPEDGTAVDALLHHFPQLENPVLNYLTTDEDDSVGTIKLKQALEGAGITVGVTTVIKGLAAFKRNFADSVVADYKAKRIKARNAIKILDDAGETADDVSEAIAKTEDPNFIGPSKPKKPKETDVIVDEDALAKLLKDKNKQDAFDEIDLPINHKNFTSTKEVQIAIDTVIKSIRKNGYKEKWDNVLPNDDVLRLADELDINEDVLIKGLTNVDDIAELPIRVIATKKVLQGLGKEAVRLAKQMSRNVDALDEARLLKSLALIVKTTDELKTAIKAAARTTQAGRIKTGAKSIDIDELANVAKAFDGNLDEFAKKIAAMDNFGDVNKALNQSWAKKSWDMFTEFYVNALLSGPFTQVINTGSTIIETFFKPLELISGSLVTGNVKGIRQGFSRYRGMIKGIDDTLKSVYKTFKSEDLTGDVMGRIIENKRPRAISSDNLGIKYGKSVIETAAGLIVDTFGIAFRLPSRILLTSDELFKQINYRAKLHELAVNKGLEKGLKGKTLDDFIQRFEKKGFDNNGKFTNKEARVYSRESTFTANLMEDEAWVPGIGQGVQDLMAIPYNPLKTVAPFVRTPVNLWRHTVRRMPLIGMLQKQNFNMLRAGGTQMNEVIGRQIFGSLLVYKIMDMAINKEVTGKGPMQPQLREAWLATHKPYSFKVRNKETGETEWVSYQRMDPRFAMIGLVADYHEFWDATNVDRDKNVMAGILVSLATNLTSKSYLTGSVDLIEAIGDKTKMAKWTRDYQASFTPYSSFMRQTNNDQYMREVRSYADTVYGITPDFLDGGKKPPVRVNFFGEPQLKAKGVIGFTDEWWAPIIIGRTAGSETEPIYYELAKLAQTTKFDKGEGILKQSSRLYGTQIDLLNEKYYLNGKSALDVMHQMLATYKLNTSGPMSKYNGKTVKQALSEIIDTPAYKADYQDEGTGRLNVMQAKMIKSTYNTYKTAIREHVINNIPALKKDYTEQKGGFYSGFVATPDADAANEALNTIQELLNY